MRRAVAARLLCLVLLPASATLVACGDPDSPDPADRTDTVADTPAKNGTGELRRDLGPLVKRWPVLDGATAATWLSGTRGNPDVPGPSTYWIDAVVTLDPATLRELDALAGLTPTSDTPAVVDDLVDDLPTGELLTGSALDAAFRVGDWRATAYLSRDTGSVVLVALGE
jgi:hypothetical protein